MTWPVRWAKNHKKKLLFLLIVVGGGYAVVKHWLKMLYEITALLSPLSKNNLSLFADKKLRVQKKKEHYLTIKHTSDEAIIELASKVQSRLKADFSSEEILEQLKKKPANRLELWERLKIVCLTRCIASIYATSALSLLVKVHLNIVGACLFVNTSFLMDHFGSLKRDQHVDLSSQVQKKYLENIENFVHQGIKQISSFVEETNKEIFKDLSLKDNLTLDNVVALLESFKARFKQHSAILISKSMSKDSEMNSLLNLEIDLDLDSKKKIKTDAQILNEINLDTLDIIRNPDFNYVFDSLVDVLTNQFINKLTTLMVQQIVQQESSKSDNFMIALPLAKLLPLIDKSYQLVQYEELTTNGLFLNDLKFNLFNENIYEAYSYLEFEEAEYAQSPSALKSLLWPANPFSHSQ